MCFCHRFCLHFATKFNTKSLLMFWSHLLFESSNFKFRIPSLKEKDKCWGLFFIGLRHFFYWIVYVEKFNMIWSEHLVVDNNFLVGYHGESYFNPYLNLFFFYSQYMAGSDEGFIFNMESFLSDKFNINAKSDLVNLTLSRFNV